MGILFGMRAGNLTSTYLDERWGGEYAEHWWPNSITSRYSKRKHKTCSKPTFERSLPIYQSRSPANRADIAIENHITSMLELLQEPCICLRLGFVVLFSWCNIWHILYTLYEIHWMYKVFYFVSIVATHSFVKAETGATLLELYEEHDWRLVCPHWMWARPFRSRHC
jgi:hypothetical protein